MKALFALVAVIIPAALSHAAGDLTRQEPVLVTVQLGNEKNELRFFPANITFEAGKLYRLRLQNPSETKHYFSSAGFADAVFTRKVEVHGRDGKPIAEIKGVIREIEVLPGGTAEWWLVPVKAGSFNDLKCTIEGHAAAGMTGRIDIR